MTVGIGTDNPQTNLHIKYTTGYASLRLESLSAGQNASTQYVSGGLWRWELGTGISSGTNFELYDRVNNKSCFVVKPDGLMGIGTTTPEAPLEIKSQIPHRGLIIGRENLSTKIYLHVAEGNYGYLDLGGNTQLRGNGQASYFDGFIGIGITTPEAPLEIKSQIPHRGLIIGRENLNTKIYLHVAEGDYGYLDLGGNTQLRGNGQASYFDGSLGIGTTNPDQKLTVKGKIHAEEVIIDLAVPADYVFKPNYKLMPLHQVEQFVKTNSHLPEIPSAKEITKNGLSVGEMQNKLLQKVEELTLYAIQQNKKIVEQEKKNNELELELNTLKKVVANEIAGRK